MKKAPTPENEKQRQTALESLQLLNTDEEKVFDQLTFLASQITGAKISLVSLIDNNRQWFKSHYGLDARETPRDVSFCGHVVYEGRPLIVPDSRCDERFADNPLVQGEPHVIFYAGIPLNYDGHNLGTLCVIDSTPKTLTDMQIEGLKILAEQVVAQMKLRLELKKSRDQVALIERFSAQVPGVVYQYQIFKDGRSCFPFATQGIREIYEVDPEDVKYDATIVFSRLHPDDKDGVVKSISNAASKLQPWKYDYRVVLPQKGERWLRGFAQPERLPDQSVLWHGFITDITEERKLQVTIEQNAKLSALGEMAGGIAHEINNPLAIISGNIGILRNIINSPTIDQQKAEKFIASTEKTISRIVKIIRGLKSFSRNTDLEAPETVELSKIFEDTFSLVNEKFKVNGVTFTVDSGKGLFLKCNQVQISQALMNLLNNSFDAIKDKPEKWIKVIVAETGGLAEIKVIDCGSGISPEIARKLMQPFFTTKPVGQGTGLGLSVSRGLIEKHGGKLYYDEKESNTCFTMTLPLNLEKSKRLA